MNLYTLTSRRSRRTNPPFNPGRRHRAADAIARDHRDAVRRHPSPPCSPKPSSGSIGSGRAVLKRPRYYAETILVDGAPVPATDQLFWAGFSCLVYLPSTVAPIGLTAQGLPVGVQIVGPQYGDRLCILFARLIERDYHAFMAPPDFA